MFEQYLLNGRVRAKEGSGDGGLQQEWGSASCREKNQQGNDLRKKTGTVMVSIDITFC